MFNLLSSLSSAQSWFSSLTKLKISLFCVGLAGSWIFLFLDLFLLLFESLVCLFLAAVIRVGMSQTVLDGFLQILWYSDDELRNRASDRAAEDSLAELGTELCFSHEAILLTASRNKSSIFIVTI